MRRDIFLRIYHYSIEALLLYIISFIYFMHEGIVSPILPFLTVIGGGPLIMLGLFYLFKKRPYWLVILSGLISFGLGFLVSDKLELLIIIVIFVIWRVPAHLNEADMKHELSILGITFITAIIVYLMNSFVDYTYSYVVLLLTCFQVILVMVGRFIDGLLSSQFSDHDGMKRQVKWVTIVITSMIGAVTILTFALPILKVTFFYVIKGIFFFFGILLTPLLYFLLGQEDFLKKFFDAQYPDEETEQVEPVQYSDLIDMEQATYNPLFGWTLLIIVLVVLLIWYWKKYRTRVISVQGANEIVMNTSILTNKGVSRFTKSKPPKDYVRRIFYELERYAAKHKMGRLKDETAREWLTRLGYMEDNEFVIYYETVRYEEESLTKEQKEQYDKIVKEIKRKMKENKE
ncbi:hypothetical protein [Fredinandcohnia sp. 179-A 10B2 NHS]|uniref:hypothetical protein n=1 Tax=Fredinandcohnia sp. 179-A 10B2 NHS TaxID=3235176 RepID=UPI0039A1E2F3